MNTIISNVAPNFHFKEVRTTSFVFKLITKFTVNMLLAVILSMTFFNVFGTSIDCLHQDSNYSKMMNIKCWTEGVYIGRDLLTKKIGVESVRFGVGHVYKNTEIIYQNYYQWILPVLAIKCLIFFVPRVLWRIFENETMKKLLAETDNPVISEKWKEKKKNLIAYMRDVRAKHHRMYALKYFFCELFAIITILFNMALMHKVFNNFWTEYMPAMAALLSGNATTFGQQAAIIFPLQAKCNLHVFGPSGTIEDKDGLCFLPYNVMHEKVFAFFYIWYILLLILSTLNLLSICLMLTFKNYRIMSIGRMLEKTATRRECKAISGNGDYGYWFTLRTFHHNLSPVLFQDLGRELEASAKSCRNLESKYSLGDKLDDIEEDNERYA